MANTDHQKEGERREVNPSRQTGQIARRGGYDPFGHFDSQFTSPFSMMRRMHDEMDRVFSDLLGGHTGSTGFGGGLTGWAPALEVAERDGQMQICAELPGLKPEDVRLEVTDDAIVIEGERKQEQEEKQGGRWHSERRYGHFYRTIPLPEGADSENIKAEFRNGELHVTVPVQQPKNKRRQIPIGTGSTGKQSTK